ncbi:phosphate ABC transporter substrate-binding protein PstS [Polynucleobacter sp.]|uniref:phosphate ABC transporter substrate-binding protein PstS n=1 Tax=Polynucleobacter sp. TaxID=2029855 RepID=UPI003340440C
MASLLFAHSAFAIDITGAGATFPYPIYAKWAEAYKAKTGTNFNYQSIGSSGGIKQIKVKTVDFGATDAPVKFEDLEKDGMVQFPAIIGGVVAVINVDGLKPGDIKLDGPTLADIFQGIITDWGDMRIAIMNPGVKIPTGPITVVHRADGSGTTAIFTDYLAKTSTLWKDAVGAGAAVKWPAVSSVGGKGNEGVAANVSRVKNSIGYVEYAYAKKNKMITISMKNRDGNYVMPDELTFAAAAAGTDWAKIPGMGTYITNAPGAKSWPITGASFILMYKDPEKKANSAEVLKFFDFAFKEGKKMADDLDYVPMPDATTDFIRKSVWSKVATK